MSTGRTNPESAAPADFGTPDEPRVGERRVLRLDLHGPGDASAIRLRARQLGELAGLGSHESTAFAAAVSELARNAIMHGGGGHAQLLLRDAVVAPAAPADPLAHDAGSPRAAVVARISDRGPGIADLDAVLSGRHPVTVGSPAAAGLIAAKRLSDEFDVRSTPARDGQPGGTTVTVARYLLAGRAQWTGAQGDRIAAELGRLSMPARGSAEEARDQNRELLGALNALRERQVEVERLNAELAETNRGVLALYAELDEKAASLQRASTLKTRFLSDMTHELRTPLNAMISLSRLLLDRVDGDLTTEQERQVEFINKSATSLGDMVNDLLDIARIEAGKTDLRLARFDVSDVLSALRGMFRPLLPEDGRVQLHIDEAHEHCPRSLVSDERKLSQILRNLISNALKFTERGEVRVRVECDETTPDRPADASMLRFIVTDTGIGIAPSDLPRLFHDFEQIDSPIQRRVRGTGLGLPLTRKLARLLGGDVTVRSEPNAGSTFTLTIPSQLPGSDEFAAAHGGRGGSVINGEEDARHGG